MTYPPKLKSASTRHIDAPDSMTTFSTFFDLMRVLQDPQTRNGFLPCLRDTEMFSDVSDGAERDVQLITAFYLDLTENARNLTLFSTQVGMLIEVCIEQLPDRRGLLANYVDQAGSPLPLEATTLSCLLTFCLIATSYDPLVTYFREYVEKAVPPHGVIDAPLMVGVRAFLTAVSLLHSPTSSQIIPLSIRKTLLEGWPSQRAREVASMLEKVFWQRAAMCHHSTIETSLPGPVLNILFALDDFVFEELNTLTKLYCDYFYCLANDKTVRITVRVFRITFQYNACPIPVTWDPPIGSFVELLRKYFGADADRVAERIDFQFVDCWNPKGDYFSTVRETIAEARPDVCVTCLDRHHSFLEIVLYASAPLLQVEIVNRSGFVRYCDALIPNGAVASEQRGAFHYVDALLPQIPFPIKEKVTKEMFGFTSGNYVLAVVGKNFTGRMQAEGNPELSLAFARTLAGLLVAEPILSILLIGETPTEVAQWFDKAGVTPDKSRVGIIAFAKDLRSTMLACDLIVNPPIRGGGRGMALAISDRLPLLIFSNADAANFVPTANIAQDLTDFVLKVWRYVRLGLGWRESYFSRSGLIPFSQEYNRSAAASFVEAARTAASHGRARLAGKK